MVWTGTALTFWLFICKIPEMRVVGSVTSPSLPRPSARFVGSSEKKACCCWSQSKTSVTKAVRFNLRVLCPTSVIMKLRSNFGFHRHVYFFAFVLQVFAKENLLDLDCPYSY